VESAELIALLHEVRARVRARNPETGAGGVEVALPDLMPLSHARDAALGKVAAIGTVNPRAGGVVNSLVQSWKRLVARVLDSVGPGGVQSQGDPCTKGAGRW
jgi:hypothetical protein